MKFTIEARGLVGAKGIQTYIRELVKHLTNLAPEDTIEMIHGSAASAKEFQKTQNVILPLRSELLLPWWLNRSVYSYIQKSKPSLVHFTKVDIPTKPLTVPTIVTMYDVIPLQLPKSQSPLRRVYWKRALTRAAQRSDHIITISNASKHHICDYFSVDSQKISAIPLAVDHTHFYPRERTYLDTPYILFVGRWDERKNIKSLIHAFSKIASRIPHTLIIAGRAADKRVNFSATIKASGVADRIRFLENVSYADLPQLYSNADLFVYPSILEGWGLPPLEAMACGTPVVVSNGEPMREVVGAAAEIVSFTSTTLTERLQDNEFIRHLGSTVEAILLSPEKQSALRTAGLAHAQTFSWSETARQTLAVYRTIAV